MMPTAEPETFSHTIYGHPAWFDRQNLPPGAKLLDYLIRLTKEAMADPAGEDATPSPKFFGAVCNVVTHLATGTPPHSDIIDHLVKLVGGYRLWWGGFQLYTREDIEARIAAAEAALAAAVYGPVAA